ncbi:MAG TPA: DUF1761 domain-containing protein [Flavisolibacter sp.]|jgi:hypothetical protein|nr:DUF1761 domain-containing protein [Flavisolibacter sp.]
MYATNFGHINWLHVLVAAVAYFALGSIWYSVLFGKKWVSYQKINMNDPDAKKGAATIMVGSFILMAISTIGLAILINRLDLLTALSGIKLGLLTGFCFSAMAISISYLYVKRPGGLHLIDGLYHIVGQAIAAAIIAAWH